MAISYSDTFYPTNSYNYENAFAGTRNVTYTTRQDYYTILWPTTAVTTSGYYYPVTTDQIMQPAIDPPQPQQYSYFGYQIPPGFKLVPIDTPEKQEKFVFDDSDLYKERTRKIKI